MLASKYLIPAFSLLAGVVLAINLPKIADARSKFNQIEASGFKQNNQSYIGLRYRDFPRGLKGVAGWIVGDSQAAIEYGIAQVQKGNQQMLWLQIIVARDSKGIATFQVIDVLNLPKISKSETIAGAGSPCLLKGVRDVEIIAIAKYQDAEYWRQIKQAWRANRITGKFEAISPRNITCENPSWGV